MGDRIRIYAAELLGTAISAGGAYTSRQTLFDYWFRQCGTFVAITVGVLTIITIVRNEYPELLPMRFRKKPKTP